MQKVVLQKMLENRWRRRKEVSIPVNQCRFLSIGVDSCQSVLFGEESIPVNRFHSEDAIPVYQFLVEESIPVNRFHLEESIPVNMKFPTITLCKPFQPVKQIGFVRCASSIVTSRFQSWRETPCYATRVCLFY